MCLCNGGLSLSRTFRHQQGTRLWGSSTGRIKEQDQTTGHTIGSRRSRRSRDCGSRSSGSRGSRMSCLSCRARDRRSSPRGTGGSCGSRRSGFTRGSGLSRGALRSRGTCRSCGARLSRRTLGSRRSNDLSLIRDIATLIVGLFGSRLTIQRTQIRKDLASRDQHEFTNVC
jgi:hypothetical protein